MAISTIGGATASGGTSGPSGSKLQVGGYSSTGSYTATIPGGDYFFIAPYGAKLSCNGTTYNGVIDQTASYGSSNIYNYSIPQGNYVRVAGQQSVTVTTGALPVSARLGQRNFGSTLARNYNRNAVRFAGTTYAFPDNTNSVVWTSTNGTSWTSNTTTFSIGNCFMVANGVFFAGDTTNTNILYTSTDAVTWTQRIMPTATVADGRLSAVVYSGSKYVAFFRRGTGFTCHTFTSTDAITWTYGAAVTGASFTTVADYGVFVAASPTTIVVGGDGYTANTFSAYSTNGTSWTAHTTAAATNQYWNALEYVNGQFLMASQPSGINSYTVLWNNSTGQVAAWSGASAISFFGLGTSGAQVTGINWDGTNYVLTASNANSNSQCTVAYSSSVTGAWTTINPLGWSNTDGAVNAYYYGIFSSQYVNGRWFFNSYDYRARYSYNLQQTATESFLFYSTGTFPTLQAPGSFALYRLYEQATLN